jgi:hypothetical protein
MNDRDRPASHSESCSDLHMAPRVPRGNHLGIGFEDGSHLVTSDLPAQIRVSDAVETRATTASIGIPEGKNFQPRDGPEHAQRRVGDPLGMKQVARRIQDDPKIEGCTPDGLPTLARQDLAHIPNVGSKVGGLVPEEFDNPAQVRPTSRGIQDNKVHIGLPVGLYVSTGHRASLVQRSGVRVERPATAG